MAGHTEEYDKDKFEGCGDAKEMHVVVAQAQLGSLLHPACVVCREQNVEGISYR